MRIALALVASILTACAETPAPVTPAQPTREENAVMAARACSKLVSAGQQERIVDCMPDEVVKMLGGREQVVAMMNKAKAESGPQPELEEAVIEAPSQLVKAEKRTFAIVPQTVTVKVPEGRLMLKSFLLAVSPDDGKTWRFVDGVELDRQKALTIFPDLPETLQLPKVGEPELQKPEEKPKS